MQVNIPGHILNSHFDAFLSHFDVRDLAHARRLNILLKTILFQNEAIVAPNCTLVDLYGKGHILVARHEFQLIVALLQVFDFNIVVT